MKGGGHGTVTALGAAALAVLSIGTGKHFAFRAAVDTAADEIVAGVEPHHHAERTRDAEGWVALGAQPTAAQIETYLAEHGFDPVPPNEFAAQEGPALAAFAAAKPSLEQWRDDLRAEFTSGASFVTYLQDDFHPADILFVLLGIASRSGWSAITRPSCTFACARKNGGAARRRPRRRPRPTRPPPSDRHIRLPGSTSNVIRQVRVARSSTVPIAAIAASNDAGW